MSEFALFETPACCMAPMVRASTLPLRLIAAEYGADLVYSEELVATQLARAIVSEHPTLGTTDYTVPGSPHPLLRIAPVERGRLVVQLGASEAAVALAAASAVQGRVAAVDLNMGCPHHFSVACGMGQALLVEPFDAAAEILRTLSRNLCVPVTCKIRLLPTVERTVEVPPLPRPSSDPLHAITILPPPSASPAAVPGCSWHGAWPRAASPPSPYTAARRTSATATPLTGRSCRPSSTPCARSASWSSPMATASRCVLQ